MTQRVVLFDYGSGNLRSAERALARVGADVELTSDPAKALKADGLVVPGVGAFAACMAGLKAAKGDRIIDERLAGGRPVLGICVGMQVLFDAGVEFADGEHRVESASAASDSAPDSASGDVDNVVTEDGAPAAATPGCGQWPGIVEHLRAPVLPHMGWNTIEAPQDSILFRGLDDQARFYFVHSYAVRRWEMGPSEIFTAPAVTWAEHGERFVAAVENGPLSATQFHPEKSSDAGAHVLENWVRSLR